MTEQEWLACTNPERMIGFLKDRVSPRKSRLFAVAWCRKAWSSLKDQDFWRYVDLAERLAEGEVSDQEGFAAVERLCQGRDGRYLGDWEAAMIGILDPAVHPTIPAESAARFVKGRTCGGEAALFRCVFGNPFQPVGVDTAWRMPDVKRLAEAIYNERAFDRLPILADALEQAGCHDNQLLGHCRRPGPHVRGCFVVDLLLEKE
jgi:hypothetical protein